MAELDALVSGSCSWPCTGCTSPAQVDSWVLVTVLDSHMAMLLCVSAKMQSKGLALFAQTCIHSMRRPGNGSALGLLDFGIPMWRGKGISQVSCI